MVVDLDPERTVIERSMLPWPEVVAIGRGICGGERAAPAGATWAYLAPEQLYGGRVDARAGVYTIGVVLYELLVGRRPYPDARDPGAALAAILGSNPPSPRTATRLPVALDHLVMRCLAREPDRRPRDAAELARELAAIDDDAAARPTYRLAARGSEVDALLPTVAIADARRAALPTLRAVPTLVLSPAAARGARVAPAHRPRPTLWLGVLAILALLVLIAW